MKLLKSILIIGGIIFLLTGVLAAKDINSKTGTSAFSFLKINVGARAVSMGGAFTGLADDASALYYNPAGIAAFEEKKFILGYHNYFVDMQSGIVGYIKPVSQDKVLAGYVNYLNYGDFIRTNADGSIADDPSFGGGNLQMAVAFGYRPKYNYLVGASAKFIYEKIDAYSATGLALDLGFKYMMKRGRYGFGLMVQNLGFQMSSLGEEKDELPLIVRGGASIRPRGLPVIFAGDIIVPIDNDPYFAVGGEYFELKPLYIRIGWNSFGSNYRAADSDDNWAGLNLGVGFDYKKMHLAYAFSPAADLGQSHRITITGGI